MDRITLEVIGSALLTVAEGMGAALIRASYSTNIKERRDCSTAIFDARGQVIAQAEQNARESLLLCRRGYVLVMGQTRAEGPGRALLEDPEIRRAYLSG